MSEKPRKVKVSQEQIEKVGKKVTDAARESRETGKQVQVDLIEKKEARKKLKGKKVDRSKLDGSKLNALLESRKDYSKTCNCGTFSISDKKWDEENQVWDYEFDFDDDFIGYAQVQLNKPEGVTGKEIKAFAYSILLAKEKGELSDGVDVVEHEQVKRVKFYKKYK